MQNKISYKCESILQLVQQHIILSSKNVCNCINFQTLMMFLLISLFFGSTFVKIEVFFNTCASCLRLITVKNTYLLRIYQYCERRVNGYVKPVTRTTTRCQVKLVNRASVLRLDHTTVDPCRLILSRILTKDTITLHRVVHKFIVLRQNKLF